MRNTLLCTLLSVAGTAAMAQPTLTGANINAVPGDKFYAHYCDPTGISKGAGGPGVTWNLATLTTMFSDTTTYVACVGSPYCDSFPGSTIATFDGFDYNYFITDAGRFAMSGVGSAGGNSTYYTNPQDLINYPTTYNTVRVDTYYSVQPSYAFHSYGIDSFIADGYGKLILPSGTYTNVLRVHMISYTTDSDAFSVTHYRSDNYFWYNPGFHNPLAIMSYDTSGTGIPTLVDVIYFTSPNSTTLRFDDKYVKAGINVYPNPATDKVYITLNSARDETAHINITDMAGRRVGEERRERLHAGTNSLDYDVASLPGGIYLLRVQTGDNNTVRKISIAR